MLRIRAIVGLVIMLGLVAGTGGGLRGSVALAATTLAPARSFPSPYNVQGLAYGGGSLWAATPSAYDPTREYDPITRGYTGIIFELDPATGAERKSFPLPVMPTGLTHDGTYLYATQSEGRAWCDSGVSRTTPGAIVAIAPATGEVVRTIPSPLTGGQGGLAVVNGKLFAVGAVQLDACANNGQGSYLGGGNGVVIVAIDPATGALLGYRNLDALGHSPRELDANGTNLLYGTSTCPYISYYFPCAGMTVSTLAPTLTGEVLQTDVLAMPSQYGVNVHGLAASANELFAANRGDGKIYVFPYVGPLAITGLSPASATVNDPAFTTLTVDGEGFDQGATILWNEAPLSTTLVAPGRLAGTVPSTALATVGTAEIVVRNGDGRRSTPRAFFITETAAAITSSSSGTSTSDTGTATTTVGESTATATGSGTITLAEYSDNPVVAPPPTTTATYFDVYVAAGSAFSAITLQNCDLGGGNIIYWYNSTVTPAAWEPVSNQSYDPATDCITLTLTVDSAPNLTQLTRTEFAVGKEGFLAPLRAGTANHFKVGSTIPVKLVGPAAGRTVTLQVLDGDQTASSYQFRYDSGCGCHIYNLGTKSGFTAGSQYTLVALVDGQRVAAIVITGKK